MWVLNLMYIRAWATDGIGALGSHSDVGSRRRRRRWSDGDGLRRRSRVDENDGGDDDYDDPEVNQVKSECEQGPRELGRPAYNIAGAHSLP